MVSGKLGYALAVASIILLPIEKWKVAGLGPADFFLIGFIIVSWPAFWRARTRISFPLIFPWWVIFIGGFIGLLTGIAIIQGLIAVAQEIYLLIMFWTVVNVIKDRETFYKLLRVWVIVGVIESVMLLMQRFGFRIPLFPIGGKADILGADESYLSSIGRAVGTFLNTNAAGGYMLISFFILLAMPYPRNRWIRYTLLALMLGGIFSTGSNSALGGLGLGLLIAILFWAHRRGRTVLLGLGAGIIVGTAVLLSAPTISSAMSSSRDESAFVAFSRAGHKLEKRLILWTNGTDLSKAHPYGIGPNVTSSITGISLHNDYLAFYTERGQIGFIGLILLLGELFYWLVLAARDGTKWRHHLGTGAFTAGLIGLSIMASVHEISHGRAVWLFYAFIYIHYKLLWAEVGQKSPETAVRLQSNRSSLEVAHS